MIDYQPPVKRGLFNTNKQLFVDSVLNANKNLDWVNRLYNPKLGSIQIPGEAFKSTHFMSDDGNGYVFPSVVNIGGKLQYLGDRAEDYARQTNTGIQLPRDQGTWFANNGYKNGTNVNNSINEKGIPYNNPKIRFDNGIEVNNTNMKKKVIKKYPDGTKDPIMPVGLNDFQKMLWNNSNNINIITSIIISLAVSDL